MSLRSRTYRPRGLVLTEHELEVPLDHERPDGEKIVVFAREVADPDGRDRPFLVFLQGGPGFEASRAQRHPSGPAWLDRALEEFRVVMLDQRGTGRSTPVGVPPGSSAEQAEYLRCFRADAIVRDAELVRQALGSGPWSVLGQSFGGFCAVTYLSIAPEGLREVLITGGLPPVGRHTDELYAATYALQRERLRKHYERYPEDRERVRALVARDDLVLPTGDALTARRVRQVGHGLGMSDGSEGLHHLLELPPESPAFLHDVAPGLGAERNPLYAVLHEAGWADGHASRWSAERMMPDDFREDPTLLFGEHVLPWMFEEIAGLRPLREAADLLAEREWPNLYDPAVLAANEVPVAAIAYEDDPYVPASFGRETAALIRGTRLWVTNEYLHNGLRADGDRILGRLVDMARGRA